MPTVLAILLVLLGALAAAFVVLLLEPVEGRRESGRRSRRIGRWRRESLGLI